MSSRKAVAFYACHCLIRCAIWVDMNIVSEHMNCAEQNSVLLLVFVFTFRTQFSLEETVCMVQ